jgi:peroxiredoxin
VFAGLLQNPRIRVPLFAGVLLFAVLWVFASRVEGAPGGSAAAPPSPQKGFAAPDFALETLEGETIALSDLRGQVVALNFWASWCAPCRLEMPAIEQVYRSFGDLGLVVLAVNTTDQDSIGAAQDFVNEFNLTFPILLDRAGDAARLYEIYGLPTTYFIDRQGIIQEVVVGGPMSEALVQSKIEALLREVR